MPRRPSVYRSAQQSTTSHSSTLHTTHCTTHYVLYRQPSSPPRTRLCSISVLHASLLLQASSA